MTTALIVIDVQESFRRQPEWDQISTPDIVDRVNRLVAAARESGDLVVWVLHASPVPGSPFHPASGLVALQPGLEAREAEPTLVKTSHNAFTTTALGQLLTHRGVRRVRLAGIRTEQCVETTARLAADLGYQVQLVIDACATHPLPLADGSGTLSAEEVTARTAAALSGRFATITTVDEVVAG